MTTKTMKITKTRARPTPAPAPIATPEQPKATTSEDLATQCNRCSELIDSLEAQMGELEEQHAHHEQALEQMRAEQEIRHQSYDTLKTAIEVTQERVLGLKLSLAVTRGTPSETATQAMLEQHQRTLAEYKQELKELEELDVKRGESDAKSSARQRASSSKR